MTLPLFLGCSDATGGLGTGSRPRSLRLEPPASVAGACCSSVVSSSSAGSRTSDTGDDGLSAATLTIGNQKQANTGARLKGSGDRAVTRGCWVKDDSSGMQV